MTRLLRRAQWLLTALLSFSFGAGAQTLDPTFHVPAIYSEAAVQDAVPLPGGQVVVAGSFTRANGQPVVSLARFTATGALDQVFQQNLAGTTLRIEQLHPLANGQVLVQGDYQAGATQRQQVFRLNADGTLDPTFTLTFPGPYLYPNVIQTIVQPDGRVLVLGFLTGNTDSADLIRLLPNGTRDPSFQVTLEAFSQAGTYMVLQPDGKVLVGGTLRKVNGVIRWWFARLNSDGTTDTAYQPGISPGASYLAGTNAMTLDANGSLLVGGSYANRVAGQTQAIFRLLPSGALDPAFTLDASLAGRNCRQLVVQPTGAIVALFDSYVRTNGQDVPLPFSSQLVRLLPSGALDPSFQPGSADFALSEVRGLANGNLLTWGYFCNFAGQRRTLALLQPNGGLDANFAPQLQVPGHVEKIVRQADGKLLLAGTFNSIDGHFTDRVARLLPTGYPDLSFSWRQPASAMWTTTALATQANGQVLLAGATNWSNLFTATSATYEPLLTRLTASGAPDASFVPAVTLSPSSSVGIRFLAEQPDGNIVAGGAFVDGTGKSNLIRLTPTGSVDNTFTPASAYPVVSAGLLQPTGTIVCLTASATRLERLLPTGQPDLSFAYTPPAGAYTWVEQVYADPVAGGYLTSGVLSPTQVLTRLTATGTSVPSFTTPFQPVASPALPYSGVKAVVVQPDGKLLVGGYMQQSSSFGAPSTLLARLTPTGQLDTSFASPLVPSSTSPNWFGAAGVVEALALQPDGAVVVGGYFLTAAGQPVTGLVRLLAPTALPTRASAALGSELQVWPVPAQGVLHLALGSAAPAQRVSLLNTLGQIVQTQKVVQPELTLSTASLARGLYMLRVEYATGIVLRPIVLN